MITALIGTITEITDTAITLQLDTLFISVIVPDIKKYTLQEKITIKTYLHWNPEQGFSLYGFQKEIEKIVFLELLQCGGVGPRLALTIVGTLTISEFFAIVRKNDLEAMTNIPGIGQKKGEQILLYMKHAIKKIEHLCIDELPQNQLHAHMIDVEKTLATLQYTKSEIQTVVRHIYQDSKDDSAVVHNFDLLLRKALKYLSISRNG